MQNEASFQIKSYRNVYKCVRQFRIKAANARWLAKVYRPKIRTNPKWRLRDFVVDVLEKYGLDVSVSQCFRAKQMALGEVESSLIKHYAKLWNYGAEIKRSNFRSTVRFEIDRASLNHLNYFKRMYVCFDAVKKGWLAGCRLVIGS